MAHPDRFQHLWESQELLNRLFRPEGPPETFAGRTELTKEMVLHLISETDEFLRKSGAWKVHRRLEVPENRPAQLEELSDIFSYWVTIAQIWGYTPDELFEATRRKHMVVRQRHSEEWVQQLDRPSVIVDIDMVLANYQLGFIRYLVEQQLMTPAESVPYVLNNTWLDAEHLGMDATKYAGVRHYFRTSDRHTDLPVMPGAHEFLAWCRTQGWQIILLTSRPIHNYPNLYTETLIWLDANRLPFDRIWWAWDKAEMCLSYGITKHVVFAVDDDQRFVLQFAKARIPTFWLTPRPMQTSNPLIEVVRDIREIPAVYAATFKGATTHGT